MNTECFQRFLGPGTQETKSNSFVLCIVAGLGRTQPSTTCDPTKHPGAGWSGTIMVSEYSVGNGGKKEVELFMG